MAATRELAAEEGLGDAETLLSNRKVGRVLSRLRLRKAPRSGGKGSRLWQISMEELRGLATAYGVPWPRLAADDGAGEPQDTTSRRDDGAYAQIVSWVTGSHQGDVFQ